MKYYKKDNKYFIPEEASVFTVHCPENVAFQEHQHDFVELVYMMKGKCTHIIDGKEYPVKHGDLVVINYHETHRIEGCGAGTYVNLLLKPEYISKNLDNRENAFALLKLSEFEDFRKILDETHRMVTFSGEERVQVESMISALQLEMTQQQPGFSFAVQSWFNLLILMIFRKMSWRLEEGFDGISDRLLGYLETHCGEKLTLEKVAGLCFYHPSYFSRVFKTYTGLNFTEWLKQARMNKAIHLLETTELSVNEILYQVGYSNTTKFFADFKAYAGMPPLKYRKSKK